MRMQDFEDITYLLEEVDELRTRVCMLEASQTYPNSIPKQRDE